jgi:hypothetical protein
MKKAVINCKEGEINSAKKISIDQQLLLDDSFVDVAHYITNMERVVLLQFTHRQATSTLNLTGISPYVLVFFNDELEYKGASYSIKSGTGSFTISSPYKNILFLRMPHAIDLNKIISLTVEASIKR